MTTPPFPIWCRVTSASRPPGFTLIEILMVITVMLIIITASFAGLGGTLRSMALTTAGNQLVQLCDAARQRAMSANVLTALVVVTNLGVPEDGRAVCLLECQPGGQWKQLYEWQFLPEGTTLDLSASVDYLDTFATHSPTIFPFNAGQTGAPVAFKQHTTLPAGSYAARIFLPGGSLKDSSVPSKFQIVEGNSAGGRTEYSQAGGGPLPVNYYQITLIGATGGTKVERP